jgi:hypothetical protein
MFSGVLRISDVSITKEALEAALEARLDRFESMKSGFNHLAQLNIPAVGDDWNNIIDCISAIGPRIAALQRETAVGKVTVDLAVTFSADYASLAIEVPSRAAAAIGSHGIDIEFSVYLTSHAD